MLHLDLSSIELNDLELRLIFYLKDVNQASTYFSMEERSLLNSVMSFFEKAREVNLSNRIRSDQKQKQKRQVIIDR